MSMLSRLTFRTSGLEYPPIHHISHNIRDMLTSNTLFLLCSPRVCSPCPRRSISPLTEIRRKFIVIDSPTSAQFRVLGILNDSDSIFQPQYKLNEASHMRYLEYALELLPSPPRYNDSAKSSGAEGRSYGLCFDLSYRESNVQAQHGIER